MKIQLKGGEQREFDAGNAAACAKQIGEGLYKASCAARVNGKETDLRVELHDGDSLEIITFDEEYGKKAFWHTASHVLAQAVKHLYPDAKLAIGPAIDNGFYYDIDSQTVFTPETLELIENEMRAIVKQAIAVERFELPRDEALKLMQDEPYKIELINDLPADSHISFYRQGDFTDLCAGPHLMSTAPLSAIKLLNVTGAYWRGDSRNKMLQRIYGVAFPKASALKEYLELLEETKKRDHRKLGRELELFELMEEGPGFPFFLPNGMIVRNELENYWREVHTRAGYQEIKTPIMLNRALWERSGHWGHYKNNMYTTVIDDTDFAIKPMNCPGGMLVYASKLRSYRDLPLRMGELGLVHRHELSGTLHGLFRVRCFTQDDAHIFMTEDQIEDEILGVVKLIDEVYTLFGFEYAIELSTMPEDHLGSVEQWDLATAKLKSALDRNGMPYKINEGDGAFYGPKIDFHLRDCLGRTWQCGTIQLDFQLPERFDLTYIGQDNEKHRPVVIHRVVLGSIERFIGVLIEHCAGALPMWLSPVQAVVVPISQTHHEYAREVLKRLTDAGIRADSDERNEKMGYKIREAQLHKIPYMLVVGDKEMADGAVAVRARKEGEGGTVSVDDFIAKALDEIKNKK